MLHQSSFGYPTAERLVCGRPTSLSPLLSLMHDLGQSIRRSRAHWVNAKAEGGGKKKSAKHSMTIIRSLLQFGVSGLFSLFSVKIVKMSFLCPRQKKRVNDQKGLLYFFFFPQWGKLNNSLRGSRRDDDRCSCVREFNSFWRLSMTNWESHTWSAALLRPPLKMHWLPPFNFYFYFWGELIFVLVLLDGWREN